MHQLVIPLFEYLAQVVDLNPKLETYLCHAQLFVNETSYNLKHSRYVVITRGRFKRK